MVPDGSRVRIRGGGLVKMKRSMQVLAVAAAATMIVLVSVAPAFARPGVSGTSAECARCHSPRARVGAPVADFKAAVNYSKCKTCHWLTSRTRTGYFTHRHGLGSNCAGCHTGFGSGPAYSMGVRTAAGYFSTANYAGLSASQMHSIHVRGSWAQSSAVPAACASCHAPAACDSCHAAPATHSGHAYNATNRSAQFAPVLAWTTRGTPANNAVAVTARVQSATCTTSRCHVVSADGATVSKPVCATCHATSTALARAAGPVAPSRPLRVR